MLKVEVSGGEVFRIVLASIRMPKEATTAIINQCNKSSGRFFFFFFLIEIEIERKEIKKNLTKFKKSGRKNPQSKNASSFLNQAEKIGLIPSQKKPLKKPKKSSKIFLDFLKFLIFFGFLKIL